MNDRLKYLIEYIASIERGISLTKLLKYLFVIDATAVTQLGYDITESNYRAWKMGPVNFRAYDIIRNQRNVGFKNLEITYDGNRYYLSLNSPEIKEEVINQFSKAEIRIIDSVLKEYASCSAEDMINELHEPGSLWHNTVVANNLLNDFETNKLSTSDIILNFEELLLNDSKKLEQYREIKENETII